MDWLRLMNKIKSFFKLSSDRKSLFIQSMILTISILLLLSLLSFPRIKIVLNTLSRRNTDQKNSKTVEDIIWSVKAASHYFPNATCLTQAIVAQIQLSKHNFSSTLNVGVNKLGEFEAHAWIEIGDKIILGESETDYTPIWKLDK